jgi:hypothetical protein
MTHRQQGCVLGPPGSIHPALSRHQRSLPNALGRCWSEPCGFSLQVSCCRRRACGEQHVLESAWQQAQIRFAADASGALGCDMRRSRKVRHRIAGGVPAPTRWWSTVGSSVGIHEHKSTDGHAAFPALQQWRCDCSSVVAFLPAPALRRCVQPFLGDSCGRTAVGWFASSPYRLVSCTVPQHCAAGRRKLCSADRAELLLGWLQGAWTPVSSVTVVGRCKRRCDATGSLVNMSLILRQGCGCSAATGVFSSQL